MTRPSPLPPPTAKERAHRIELGYVRGASRLDRIKRYLGWVALGLALAWMGSSLVGVQSREIYSRGPLADVHAMWDHQCDACHAGFQPVRNGTVAAWFGSDSSQTDHLCQACHQGPPHHANQVDEDVPSCATCHRDHRGRGASLVRLDDAQCTACHADLESHLPPGTELKFAAHVTGFSADEGHPPFRTLEADDPGWLKFTHAQHLQAGMPRVPGEAGWFRLNEIDGPQREAYRQAGQSDDDLVQLDCRSCHALDTADELRTAGGSQPAGEYYLPVRYEQHCQACHPLPVDSPAPVVAQNADQPLPAEQAAISINAPHGLQPRALRQWLMTEWLATWIRDDGEILAAPIPSARHPGRHTPEAMDSVEEAMHHDVNRSLTLLFQHAKACGKCHYYERDGQVLTTLSSGAVSGDLANLQVIPPAMPQIWFQHARFNHLSHRAVDCRECHLAAYPEASTATRWDGAAEGNLVLLPNIETCRQCHGPLHGGSAPSGGARFDCTECHRYHHGDTPQHGLGTAARGAVEQRPIEDLLLGRPRPVTTDVVP